MINVVFSIKVYELIDKFGVKIVVIFVIDHLLKDKR